MKRYFLISLTILFSFGVKAQNGKLIAQNPYTLADTNIVKLRKIIPDIDSILENVNFSEITYLSDGLKVKGFMAMPKRKGKYPCVIFNRGGNRDFGALRDFQIARFLDKIASWGYVVVASQYRGNMGSEGKEELGGKDVNDVLNLLPGKLLK